jgi:hypothetical protein
MLTLILYDIVITTIIISSHTKPQKTRLKNGLLKCLVSNVKSFLLCHTKISNNILVENIVSLI